MSRRRHMTVPLRNPVAFSSSCLMRKTQKRKRERDYVRDEWRDDRCENRVNFQTPTRQPTANVRRFPLLQGQIVVVTRTPAQRATKAVFKFIALRIALAYAVGLVCFGNDQPVCLINNVVARGVALVCFAFWGEITLSTILKDLWPLY